LSAPRPGTVAELVRLPATLSAPGDVLVGAACAGQQRDARRTAGRVAASWCLYASGMALNDYADRAIDAIERPGRPIPSGRVSPAFALDLAAALSLVSIGRGAERAIFVTLRRYSRPAREEAVVGTPTVDLIDGDRLAELVLEQGLGVTREPVVKPQWFDRFDKPM
jgi:hypothetical protein